MESYSLVSNVISKSLSKTQSKTQSLALNLILVFTGVAFLAALSQISVPFPGSPVPITGQTLGVLLIGSTYGFTLSNLTYLTYLISAFLGLPFFAGGGSGWKHIAGPTGGYLVGMWLASAVISYLTTYFVKQKLKQKKFINSIWFNTLFVLLVGEVVIFTLGVTWLKIYTGKNMGWALQFGFYPFLIGEFLKIAIATQSISFISKKVR